MVGYKFVGQKKRKRRPLYACRICSRPYTTSSIDKHTRKCLGVKDFLCGTCHKSFTTKGNLNSHLIVHLAEKPWRCDICNQRFKHKNAWKRHRRAKKCVQALRNV